MGLLSVEKLWVAFWFSPLVEYMWEGRGRTGIKEGGSCSVVSGPDLVWWWKQAGLCCLTWLCSSTLRVFIRVAREREREGGGAFEVWERRMRQCGVHATPRSRSALQVPIHVSRYSINTDRRRSSLVCQVQAKCGHSSLAYIQTVRYFSQIVVNGVT